MSKPHYMQVLTVSDILTFKISNLQKLGQGHVVQFFNDAIRWQNVKIYNRYFEFSLRYELCSRL